MRILARRPGESLVFTDGETEITIRLVNIDGDQANIGIIAPDEVLILKEGEPGVKAQPPVLREVPAK